MKLINIVSTVKKEELADLIRNHELVNERVKFDEKRGKPSFFVKEGKRHFRVKCQYNDAPVRDGGFLEGTYFIGRISERGGASAIRGVIVTAPIYHTFIAILFALFVYQCISLGGFNPVPVIMLLFSLFMFKSEFGKQTVIKRYLHRAVRKAEDMHTDV